MDDRKHVFVADIEAVFASRSQDSLTGHNLILEHLHPNSRGHFYIAKEYARLMRDHSLLASSEEWAACDTITDDYLWKHRHVTDVDEFLAARNTEYLTSGWPFKSQPSVVEPFKRTDTLHYIAEQAARNQIDWETAHSRAIDYYERHGDVANAEKESETIINQFPLDITSYLSLAQMDFNQKEFSKAEAILLASLQIQRVPVTYRVLGDTYKGWETGTGCRQLRRAEPIFCRPRCCSRECVCARLGVSAVGEDRTGRQYSRTHHRSLSVLQPCKTAAVKSQIS